MVFNWFLGFNHSFSPGHLKLTSPFFASWFCPCFIRFVIVSCLLLLLSFFCVGLYCVLFFGTFYLFFAQLFSLFYCFSFLSVVFQSPISFRSSVILPNISSFSYLFVFFYRFASFFSYIFSLFFFFPSILSSKIFLQLTLRSIEFYRALRMLRQHMKKNLQSKKPKSRRYGLKPIHKPPLKPILQPIAETHCTLQFDIRIFFSTYRDSMYRYSQHRSDLTGHF